MSSMYYDKDNKLIAALPPVRDEMAYLEAFEKIPFIDENDRLKSATERAMLVANLSNYRIGRDFGYIVDWRIADALRKGYRLSVKRARRNAFGDTYYEKIAGDTTAFILIGPSGVGKTTVLDASLNYYEQVITHQETDCVMKQLVYIKVECPPAGSMKTFLDSCLDEMEKALDYEIPDRKRYKTADQKEHLFKKCAIRWNLGLLIIDEIQNLLATKNSNLMNQFLTLTNELGVPIVYVGTDKAIDYFGRSEFFTKRRLGVEIHAKAYEKDMMWDSLLNDLWKYQWMKEYVPLTYKLNDVFYAETGGIINRVIELFGTAQREAILSERDLVEAFTPEFIDYVSKKYFSMSRESLKALVNPDASLFQIPEADLKQTFKNNGRNVQSAEITEKMETTRKILTDSGRNIQKDRKDALKNHIIANVIRATEYWPYSFTKKEIDSAIKEVFKQKGIIDKSEESITKQVISILLNSQSFGQKAETEIAGNTPKPTISVDDFPRFEGVI